MSTDLDQRLTVTLREHTGSDTDPAPIVERARLRGRRLKRRRRGLVGAAAAAFAAVAAILLLQPPAAPVHRPDAILLPAAGDQPGADTRPDLVGADPWTLHFAAEHLVAGADHVTWLAGAGIESVEYWGPAGHGRLLVAADSDRLDSVKQALSSTPDQGPGHKPVQVGVNGRDATVWSELNSGGSPLWIMRWQPADGVWARLEMYADPKLGYVEAANAGSGLDFGQARRCAVPFRLTEVPAEARVMSCSVSLAASGDSFTEGALVIGDQRRWMTVRAQRTEGDGSSEVRLQSPGVLERFVKPVAVEAFARGMGQGYPESDAKTVLEGYEQAGDLDDIGTWLR